MRSRYKIVLEGGLYFVTSTIVEWIPVFSSEPYFQIMIEAFKYAQKNKALRLYAYVVMENHFHLLVIGPTLSNTLQSLKSFTSKQIIEQLRMDGKEWALNQMHFYKKDYKHESTFQVWQEGFHPQLLSTEQAWMQRMKYIHLNPVRRGYVERLEYWKYSSARNYYSDDDSIIQLDSVWGDPPV